ncbi:glycoside hydrolase/deacetylase, partial [Piromyces finnis]
LFFAKTVATEKIYSCQKNNTIALTFDDGPYKYTSELIDLLNTKNIKATFFINVENYWIDLPYNTEKQAVIKKAYESGHQIASHTWAHSIPSDVNQFDEMMKKTDNWIKSVIGHKPSYFRAPRGECNSDCINYLQEKDYKLIQWDVDTNDWDTSNGVDYRVGKAKEFLSENFNYKRSNYLILMHDVYKHTLEKIVTWIADNKPLGYEFVTVAECLGDKSSMYRSIQENTIDKTSTTTTTINTTSTTKTTTSVAEPTTTSIINNTIPENSTYNNNNEITNDNNNVNSNELTNNNNLDSFYNNTIMNDENYGNLNYESSSTSINRHYSLLLLFSLIAILLKLFYL